MIYFNSSGITQQEHRQLVYTIRDALAGEHRIKLQGERYLPKPDGMSHPGYLAMKQRASFLNAPRVMLDGIMGRVFRKPASYALNGLETRRPWWSGSYRSWDELARELTREALSVGRVAVLVDPSPDAQFETRLTVYRDEDIEGTTIDETGTLVEVVLREGGGERTLTLSLVDGVYTAQKDDADPVTVTVAGKTLGIIPIVIVTPGGLQPNRAYPPLADLCLKAVSHYQLWAESRQGLHYTATPQPFVSGFQPTEVPTAIGPTTIWKAANPDAKAQFVTYSGEGLAELRTACETLKAEMAALGASMMVEREASNVAAQTVSLRQREDSSLVLAVVHAVGEGLSAVGRTMLEWEQRDAGNVAVVLNTELVDAQIDANLLKTLKDCYLAGALSWDSFVAALKRGEVIPSERTADEEQRLIEQDPRIMPISTDGAAMCIPERVDPLERACVEIALASEGITSLKVAEDGVILDRDPSGKLNANRVARAAMMANHIHAIATKSSAQIGFNLLKRLGQGLTPASFRRVGQKSVGQLQRMSLGELAREATLLSYAYGARRPHWDRR